jgi:hypothetical protein
MSMPGVEASESELRERLTTILCVTVGLADFENKGLAIRGFASWW